MYSSATCQTRIVLESCSVQLSPPCVLKNAACGFRCVLRLLHCLLLCREPRAQEGGEQEHRDGLESGGRNGSGSEEDVGDGTEGSFEKELHAALLQRNGLSSCPAAGFILPLKEGERNDGRLEERDEKSVLIMAGQSRALLLLQVFHLGSGPEMSVVCSSHVGYVRLHAYR